MGLCLGKSRTDFHFDASAIDKVSEQGTLAHLENDKFFSVKLESLDPDEALTFTISIRALGAIDDHQKSWRHSFFPTIEVSLNPPDEDFQRQTQTTRPVAYKGSVIQFTPPQRFKMLTKKVHDNSKDLKGAREYHQVHEAKVTSRGCIHIYICFTSSLGFFCILYSSSCACFFS